MPYVSAYFKLHRLAGKQDTALVDVYPWIEQIEPNALVTIGLPHSIKLKVPNHPEHYESNRARATGKVESGSRK